MRASGFEAREALCITFVKATGEANSLAFAEVEVLTLPWRGKVDANAKSGGVG